MDEQNNSQFNEPVKNSKNIWMIVILIVITALVVSGGVYAWQRYNLKITQQSLQTALKKGDIGAILDEDNKKEVLTESAVQTNWKIYSNDKFGYSINYPDDWRAKEYKEDKVYIFYPGWRQMPEGGDSVVIYIKDQTLEQFIEEYNSSDVLEDGTALSKIIKQENYTMGGVNGYKLTGTTPIGLDWNVIFIPRNNKAYIIKFHDYDDAHLKIIKTFKFQVGDLLKESEQKDDEAPQGELEEISCNFYKDNNFIYFGEVQKLNDIKDAKSFAFVNEYCTYGKDNKNVYHIDSASYTVTILDLDPNNFRIVEGDYVRDDENVFFENYKIKDADAKTFAVFLYRAYSNTKKIAYAKDRYAVYYLSSKIDGANPETFKIINYVYAKDENFVFLEGRKINADPNTFIPITNTGSNERFAKDKNYVFLNGEIILNADSKTFEIIYFNYPWPPEKIYTKDAYSVFWGDRKIEGADPATFAIFTKGKGEYCGKDLNNEYCNGAQVNWGIYTNEKLGFELKMPSYVSVDKVLNDQYNRLVRFKSEKENFEVRLKEGKSTSLDQYYYLDFPVSSRSTLGGKEALVFEAPNGYCDGPGCGDPFIAYSTKHGDDFYNLTFSGDTKLNDTEKSILESFKFTK